ncbi:MAG: hypothetical protein KC586_01410 [Myxococcales bacterium]|nr:hypothetical protein [Myxococcales bacterium]
MLLETLAMLGDNKQRFAHELVADLNQRHPHVLDGEEPAPDAVLHAVGRFAAATRDDAAEDDVESDVVDLADSLMKTFALVLGRVAWKPQMALEWNAALRTDGERLLSALRDL